MKKSVALVGLLLTAIASHADARSAPLVRNHLQVKAIVKSDSTILSAPRSSARKLREVKPFSFLWVFEAEPRERQSLDEFVRVGRYSHRAEGWIPAADVLFWDHRICVRFTSTQGRDLARTYRTFGDLRQAENGSVPDFGAVIAEEPGETADKQYAMLLPLLERRSFQVGGQSRRAFKVAYLASPGAERRLPPVTGNGFGAQYLDILFVIDTTLSMTPYLEKTKEIVHGIARKAVGLREAGVRVGVLGYRDHSDEQYVTKKFSDLTTGVRRLGGILGSVEAGTKTIGVEEALFDAVFEGITETGWGRGPGLRTMILVGDASSHPEGSEGNPHGYSDTQLIELAHRERVRIIALKIVSKDPQDNQRHETQLKRLTQGKTASDTGSFMRIEISSDMTSRYVDKVIVAVEQEIALMHRLLDVQAQPRLIEELSDTERAIVLRNLEPIRRKDSRVAFSEGWIAESNAAGRRQLTPHVFMSWDDLALTIFYMNTAITMAKSTTARVTDVVLSSLDAQTGEPLREGESVQQHFEKRLGLPLPSRTLNFSLAEINSWSETKRLELAERIKAKLKLLENHRDDPEEWFSHGRDYRYTFVPLDNFP